MTDLSAPATKGLVEELRKAASHAGMILTDPPRPTAMNDLLTRAADALEANARELSEAREEIERLDAERGAYFDLAAKAAILREAAERSRDEAIEALRVERERVGALEGALEPFVRFVDDNHMIGPDMDHPDETLWFGGDGRGLFVGDFRRARSVLAHGDRG